MSGMTEHANKMCNRLSRNNLYSKVSVILVKSWFERSIVNNSYQCIVHSVSNNTYSYNKLSLIFMSITQVSLQYRHLFLSRNTCTQYHDIESKASPSNVCVISIQDNTILSYMPWRNMTEF